MRCSTKLLSTLSILAMFAAMAPPAVTARTIVTRNTPICYIQLNGQAMKSLNKMCGVGRQSNIVDLSVDRNRDGVPDQLLAVVRTYRAAIRIARTPEDYQLAHQKFDARLPYSRQVRQLQAQQRQLRKQIDNTPQSQREPLYRQLSQITSQIESDPSHYRIRIAIYNTYHALSRTRQP